MSHNLSIVEELVGVVGRASWGGVISVLAIVDDELAVGARLAVVLGLEKV